MTGTGRAADRDTVLGLGADAFLDLQADHLADAGEADVVFDVIRSRPGPPASLRG